MLMNQNRAYAVSQLSDLHQKLTKAQSNVHTTRAPIPSYKEKDDKAGPGGKVGHTSSDLSDTQGTFPARRKEKGGEPASQER
jgi:Cop9 signalosome subunit 5 C-terminal domain